MNGYPDRFIEKKWRELEDVPIDYSDPEEPGRSSRHELVCIQEGRAAHRGRLALVRFPLYRRHRSLDVRGCRVD